MRVGRGVVILAVLLFGSACSGDAGSAAVDHAVAALVASPDNGEAFASAIDAVADDGADAESAQALADALPRHLDALADLDRPAVVRAFTEMFDDEEARQRAVAALIEWLVASVEPLIEGTATADETDARMRDAVAPVMSAAKGGAEQAGASPGELQRNITQPARRVLALQLAERDGLGTLAPEEWADTMSALSPNGDPIEELERAVFDEDTAHDSDDDAW